MCCSTSHVSIHIENEWSDLLINIYQHYGIWDEHIWCFMNDLNILVNHNVLSYFIHPYTPWQRMIMAVLSIICVLTDFTCHTQYTWFNLYQRYVTSDVCMYLMLVWKMLPVFLAYLPCPYTNWKRMILPSDQLLPTVYVMHILGVCITDLTSIVFHRCVILLHMSLYTFETNDLTYWSTFINTMVY